MVKVHYVEGISIRSDRLITEALAGAPILAEAQARLHRAVAGTVTARAAYKEVKNQKESKGNRDLWIGSGGSLC